jgi:D-lactate dehydrogenase
MKILFYSTKSYEQPYLETANKQHAEIVFLKKSLSVETAHLAVGFEMVSIFTGDDASAEVIEILHNNAVKYITTRAAGYDNIDIDKANEYGIIVTNVPAYSPYAIAEHTVALILALNRKIITAYKQVQQQNFATDKLIGFDLHGKTVGIIGVGIIGSVLVKIMHGFGCKILGCDLVENNLLKAQYGLEYTDKETLCARADIISIHTPLTPDTKCLINKKLISIMKPGTMLINTGRGGCVNTVDVMEGLENGQIGYYGADVYEKERGVFFCDCTGMEMKDDMLKKLLAMPNVLITPHQAFATVQALTNIADTTFYNIDCMLKNKRSKNILTSILVEDEIPGNGNN